jgi:hypothetical protein
LRHALDSELGRLPQRTLLISAKRFRGQRIEACLCYRPDHPGNEIVDDRRHAASISQNGRFREGY